MWGPMMHYGYAGWGWMMALNGLVWVVILAGLVALVLRLARSGGAAERPRSPGLDALEERYARGEIQREEFLRMKADILDGRRP